MKEKDKITKLMKDLDAFCGETGSSKAEIMALVECYKKNLNMTTEEAITSVLSHLVGLEGKYRLIKGTSEFLKPLQIHILYDIYPEVKVITPVEDNILEISAPIEFEEGAKIDFKFNNAQKTILHRASSILLRLAYRMERNGYKYLEYPTLEKMERIDKDTISKLSDTLYRIQQMWSFIFERDGLEKMSTDIFDEMFMEHYYTEDREEKDENK